ncbi:conserved hypothetical protein [Aeromonas phage 65]|uniref:ParB/Sulfiredoxin domain-containing protein n=2 Tax=Ishigurovirus osborne TaxID=260149 RepID=A0A219YC58_9CAUD|nr:hypothetical protein ST65p144 [Aeromonas phage 65]ADQ53152.1 conserved hypothetical protein [Aeromonas phage 65]APU01530.1 hypothetical protein [Aeromonas phage 65.2]
MKYEKSRGISRDKMPQITVANVPVFLEFMLKKGVTYRKERVAVKSLLPTQSEYNEDKVKNMVSAPDSVLCAPIITSDDDYILDGHHRYSAVLAQNPNKLMEIYRVDIPIDDLLQYAYAFPLTFYKGINECKIGFSKFMKLKG